MIPRDPCAVPPLMTHRRTRNASVGGLLAAALLCATALSSAACGDEDYGGPVDPYPAPELGLQDLNPASPTYLESRGPGDVAGGVLVIYFASFT